MLTGDLAGVMECHVGNAGDWLAIWMRDDGIAVFMRTGGHGELFGRRQPGLLSGHQTRMS